MIFFLFTWYKYYRWNAHFKKVARDFFSFYDRHIDIYLKVHKSKCLLKTLIVCVSGQKVNKSYGRVSYETSLCCVPPFPSLSFVLSSLINRVDFPCSEKREREVIINGWTSSRICLQKVSAT